MAAATLDLQPLPPPSGRRTEQVIRAVRAAIDDGHMKPGVKYSVYQLAEVLGISRTPVRDALLRLEEVGLIRFEARQGFRILKPQPKEIAEIFAIRIALELPAVRRAAERADPTLVQALIDQMKMMRAAADAGNEAAFAQHDQQLHDLILDAAGNARSRAIISSLRETTRLLGASTANKVRTLDDIVEEHGPIIDAIVAGDPLAAVTAMRRHLISTGKLLVSQAIKDDNSPHGLEKIWSTVVG